MLSPALTAHKIQLHTSFRQTGGILGRYPVYTTPHELFYEFLLLYMRWICVDGESCVARGLQRGREEIHTGYQIGRLCQRPSELYQPFGDPHSRSVGVSITERLVVLPRSEATLKVKSTSP